MFKIPPESKDKNSTMLTAFVIVSILFITDVRITSQDISAYFAVIFANNLFATVIYTLVLSSLAVFIAFFRNITKIRNKNNFSQTDEAKCMDGADEEQVRLMEESCILLDENDNVIGHESKKNCHLNSNISGKGLLHRAFSAFIFNSKGELLMQQRSKQKITFPFYWANSCCSHPLYTPEELETRDHLGVKRAAQRKIEQELGIAPGELPLNSFQFLARIHYNAKSNELWGEHEIDYILFCQPPQDVVPNLNPSEVADAKYFSIFELQSFVAKAEINGDLISPWFRVILAGPLLKWWYALLDGTIGSMEEESIIRRCGVARNMGTPVKQQLVPGKGKVHYHSKHSQLIRVNELVAWIKFRLLMAAKSSSYLSTYSQDPDVAFCDEMLGKTSRSFALATRQLPDELRLSVCIFYLVLRALDTIEDDTSFCHSNAKEKIHQLKTFHDKLTNPTWSISGVGDGDERLLLESYPRVIGVFGSLRPPHQVIIKDIARRMGEGMAEFVEKDVGEGTISKAEYDRYCYYVAGLVGEGLSSLFSISRCETDEIAHETKLANSMGMFLQKTNIIRDFLDDYTAGRTFWPQEVWKQYGNSLGDFKDSRNRLKALNCLNDLITDALEHIPDCLAYLSLIRNAQIFDFCAIPQVMAIATLDEVFNNDKVFSGIVKIRKGMTANIMLHAHTMKDVHRWFVLFARSIGTKAMAAKIPSTKRTLAAVERVFDACRATGHLEPNVITGGGFGLPAMLGILSYYYFVRLHERGTFFPPLADTMDVAALGLLSAAVTLMLAFYGIPFVLSVLTNGTEEMQCEMKQMGSWRKYSLRA